MYKLRCYVRVSVGSVNQFDSSLYVQHIVSQEKLEEKTANSLSRERAICVSNFEPALSSGDTSMMYTGARPVNNQ